MNTTRRNCPDEKSKPQTTAEMLNSSRRLVEPLQLEFLNLCKDRSCPEPGQYICSNTLKMTRVDLGNTLNFTHTQPGISVLKSCQLPREDLRCASATREDDETWDTGNRLANAVDIFEQHPLVPQGDNVSADPCHRFLGDNDSLLPSHFCNLGVQETNEDGAWELFFPLQLQSEDKKGESCENNTSIMRTSTKPSETSHCHQLSQWELRIDDHAASCVEEVYFAPADTRFQDDSETFSLENFWTDIAG